MLTGALHVCMVYVAKDPVGPPICICGAQEHRPVHEPDLAHAGTGFVTNDRAAATWQLWCTREGGEGDWAVSGHHAAAHNHPAGACN
jgi:hypothetical protein